MPNFLCSALLFDLDGVLVDSTPAIIEVWSAWSRVNGVEAEKVMSVMHGRRSVEVLQVVAPHLDAMTEVKAIEEAITNYKDGTVTIRGAAGLLQSLPNGRWCIVTSGLRAFATARLRAADLPVPKVLVCADDVVNGKPDPEPYLKAAQLLSVPARECLVVEDAPAGIRAAHAGGMKVIGITTTYPHEDLCEADFVIETLAQVRISNLGNHLNVEIAERPVSPFIADS